MTKQTKHHLRGFDLSDEGELNELVHLMKEDLEQGKTLKEALQIAQQDLDQIYALAYRKYQAGQYKDAIDLFQYLSTLNPDRFEYLLGLAAALQRNEQYDKAIAVYLYASNNRPEDPVPYFHGAECWLQLGSTDLAIGGLELAIMSAGKEEKYATLVERAKLQIKSLDNKK